MVEAENDRTPEESSPRAAHRKPRLSAARLDMFKKHLEAGEANDVKHTGTIERKSVT
jgi:hypothetical protein